MTWRATLIIPDISPFSFHATTAAATVRWSTVPVRRGVEAADGRSQAEAADERSGAGRVCIAGRAFSGSGVTGRILV